MWMYEIELRDGTAVHAYKHIDTRAYLLLAGDGRAFDYQRPERYVQTHPADAIKGAFAGWEDVLFEANDEAAVRAAIRHACMAAEHRVLRATPTPAPE